MIHVKKGDYAHWAVRIDRASRRVTHVSSGPAHQGQGLPQRGAAHLLL